MKGQRHSCVDGQINVFPGVKAVVLIQYHDVGVQWVKLTLINILSNKIYNFPRNRLHHGEWFVVSKVE